MSSNPYILLTGATGLLGQYLVRDLLAAGASLAVLIRPRRNESAAQRLGQVLALWNGKLGGSAPRPVCLEGDITAAGLGLSAEAREWAARHCGAVLHNAACLTFFGTDREQEPWRSNLGGTVNVLEFCRQTGLRRLHHVSTAYVCGDRPGPILESEPGGPPFRNEYEQSKYEAEQRVREAGFLDRVTVYRPAIIVGDSVTGYTSTYHGLYSYLQFAWMFLQYEPRQPDGRYYVPMRVNLTGREVRNLVPVDWVSAVIAHLVLRPEHHGRTFHLTPDRPVSAAEIHEFLADYFNFHGPVLAGPDALREGNLNALERMFYEYVERYQPYWAREPLFDNSGTRAAAPHLPCPPIDAPCLRRMTDFAIRDRWGKGARTKGE